MDVDGQDANEVLEDVGYSDEARASLSHVGIIALPVSTVDLLSRFKA